MNAEQVIKKILSDARNEAEKTKKEAEEKQASEQGKHKELLAEYKKQTKILAQKAGEEEKNHLLAAARMEIAKEYLAEKRKMLDEVFSKVQTQLLNLPDEQYRELCTKLMLEAVETGDEEVIVDHKETRIDKEFINQINKQLESSKKGDLKLSEEKEDVGAGFILRRGKIKNNVSLEVLLAEARKKLEIELAKELFEDIND